MPADSYSFSSSLISSYHQSHKNSNESEPELNSRGIPTHSNRILHYYLYLTGSMSIFSNANNKIINTVPIAAIMFTNFCAFTLLLNAFSIAINIVNPITPPKVLVIISVLSKAPSRKIY
jgi:hypothetical protein